MSMINYASREINCKIVYYGPGLGGKTTNLEHVYAKVTPDTRGKLISLATETERTLFFDFLPVDLGTIRGFKTRFHLYTVPGQVYYNASRKLILKGVDGIVFVADSQLAMQDANLDSFRNLRENLAEIGTNKSLDVLGRVSRDRRDLVTQETARQAIESVKALGPHTGVGSLRARVAALFRRPRSATLTDAKPRCSLTRSPILAGKLLRT